MAKQTNRGDIKMDQKQMQYRGGPRTDETKTISARNSTRTGLGCTELMSCNKHKCYYYSICRLRYIEGVSISGLPLNGSCIMEIAEYGIIVRNLFDMVSIKELDTARYYSDVHEYAMLCVQYNRINNYIILNETVPEWVMALKYKISGKLIKKSKLFMSLL